MKNKKLLRDIIISFYNFEFADTARIVAHFADAEEECGRLIEKKLNSMGVVNYEQIADWTADDIGRISQSLDFKGRIERENWVEQARILASGGATEFSRRVDRGELETSRYRP